MEEERTHDIETRQVNNALEDDDVGSTTRGNMASRGGEEEGVSPREEQGEGVIEVTEEEKEVEEGSEGEMVPVDRGRTFSGREGKQLGEDLMLAVKEREDGKTKEEAVGGFVATNDLLKGVVEKTLLLRRCWPPSLRTSCTG